MGKPEVFVGTDGSINHLSEKGGSVTGVKVETDGTPSVLGGSASGDSVLVTESSAGAQTKVSAGRKGRRTIVGATTGGLLGRLWALFKP